MATLEIGYGFLTYSDTGYPPGRPDAPVVVFGHGLLFGGWMFRDQIEELRRTCRCIAVDWRGQGDSAVFSDGYDMDTLTGDLLVLLRSLELSGVHYVGLSMGGFVGLRLAARHPRLVRSLTLLDTTDEAESPASARRYRRMALAQRMVSVGPLLPRLEHLMFAASARDTAVVAEWRERLRGRERVSISRAALGVAERPAVTPLLGRIEVPALVISGQEDVAVPSEQSARMARRLPNSVFHVLPGCGHSSSVERPDEVTRLLGDHLNAAHAT